MTKRDGFRYAIRIFGVCTALFFLLLLFFALFSAMTEQPVLTGTEPMTAPRFVLDAGHGGRDGGAIGVGGVAEKELNLQITETLSAILRLCGAETVLTRDGDYLVCDENDPALKGKIKMTDLINRLKIAEEHENAVFVSIHMNNFPIEKYSGLQVYYSANHASGFPIAKLIQENVVAVLQPENNRKVKVAGSNIYLLDRIQSPAVLVECGFLSNHREYEKLTSPEYQTQLALVLCDSLLANPQEKTVNTCKS